MTFSLKIQEVSVYLIILLAVVLPACGDSVKLDRPEPLSVIDQKRNAAKHMSKKALERAAIKARDTGREAGEIFRDLEAKLREIPLEKQFDKRAIKLKEEMRVYADQGRNQAMLYDSYMHYYLEKGGDYEKIRKDKHVF